MPETRDIVCPVAPVSHGTILGSSFFTLSITLSTQDSQHCTLLVNIIRHNNRTKTKTYSIPMAAGDNSPRRRRPKPLAVPGGSDEPSPSRQKKSGRRRKRGREEPPFWWLVVQVGSTLAVICLLVYGGFRYKYPARDTDAVAEYDDMFDDTVSAAEEVAQPQKQQEPDAVDVIDYQQDTYPPLPVWNLTLQSQFDAFSIAEKYSDDDSEDVFWIAAAGLRQQFVDLYGGENAARALLERGTFLFGDDTVATACRIQQAQVEKRPFRMAFGGYSVTAGRGNYFRQSFPMVMEQKLHTLFYLLKVELVVRNAAIGGCPSFPYGWCMKQFLGADPDVISWDFSMNEAGGDPVGLESYIRYALQLKRRPKLIVKDTHMADQRRDILKAYHDLLKDPVVIHTEPAARPFLDRLEQHRPVGFQEWRKFGAPPGAPGQALHHPAVREHAFIAWLLILHFMASLELLAADRDGKYHLQCKNDHEKVVMLPRPLTMRKESNSMENEDGDVETAAYPVWNSILFGSPVNETNSSSPWRMHPVHCRTSFEPIISGSGELKDLIVSGSVAEDLDIMLPKSKMYYNSGWVLDLSEGEKKAKRNLDRFGGLGFLDSKKAYYALPTSKTLRLLVPLESFPADESDSTRQPAVGDAATDWFRSIVWCEVNEKRDSTACRTDKDVTFKVGGVIVSTNTTVSPVSIDSMGTLFMGKKVCVYLAVPSDAKLTNRTTMLLEETEKRSQESRQLFLNPDDPLRNSTTQLEEAVGLSLEAKVTNSHLIRREDACSLSHIVWELEPRIAT